MNTLGDLTNRENRAFYQRFGSDYTDNSPANLGGYPADGIPDDINGDQAADLARKTTRNFVSELLRRAYAPIAKLGTVAKNEVGFAQREFRAGLYRAAGARGATCAAGWAAAR